MPRKSPPAASKAIYTNALSINRLSADVHLGVDQEERQTPQKVVVDVRFYLPALLSSAERDDGDYICYHDISEKIYGLCTGRQYRLIEYLAQEIYRLVRRQVSKEVKIWIKLHKPRILLPYVEEGASFTYTDLPPFSWVVHE